MSMPKELRQARDTRLGDDFPTEYRGRMPPEDSGSAGSEIRRYGPLQVIFRMGVIGFLVLCIIASFAYVAGWLSPSLLTPSRFVDGFERVNGLHSGFRRNHAKGVCIAGYFDSNGNGVRLSKGVFKASCWS